MGGFFVGRGVRIEGLEVYQEIWGSGLEVFSFRFSGVEGFKRNATFSVWRLYGTTAQQES